MTTSERLLSNFLNTTTTTTTRPLSCTQRESTKNNYALHHLVGLHTTTGTTVREFLKQQQSSSSSSFSPIHWQIPETGITPLHVAVFRNSYHVLSVIQVLVEVYPALNELPMMDGSLPLHIYLQHAMTMDRCVLECLLVSLNNNTKMGYRIPNGDGDYPITLLYHNVLRFQWARNWELYNESPSLLSQQQQQQQSWLTIIAPHQFLEYALLLLQTNHCYDICQSPECPPLVLRVYFYYQQQQDETNHDSWKHSFLLHAAAQATSSCKPPPWYESGSNSTWPTLISYLLSHHHHHHYPENEQQQHLYPYRRNQPDDQCQRYPMHYALEYSTNISDMKQLVDVCYDAIDPITSLPPALLYATRHDCHLDWLYEMIRADPTTVCVYNNN